MSTAAIVLFLALVLGALFFPFDLLRRRRRPDTPTERVDERDVMFSRVSRVSGTASYEEFYARRPEWQATDDRIRAMTPLMKPGARYFDPVLSREAEDYFEHSRTVVPDADLVERLAVRLRACADPDRELRTILRELGAVAVGCTPLQEEYLYTHKGRFETDYGRVIDDALPSVVVFLTEMEYEAMQRSPRAETIRESGRQYWRGAVIAKTAAAALRTAGWRAKAQFDAHYDLILPPLAVAAGLGEVGRNNILIADRYGSRVRIGAVTTDLPVRSDRPRRLGVDHFCRICRKCALSCPSRALLTDRPVEVRGLEKWTTGVEQCYAYWRQVGTDCGICMAVCPFSHRSTWFHNLIRSIIPLNPWLRHIARFGDDLVYGRVWAIPPAVKGKRVGGGEGRGAGWDSID